MTQRAHVCLAAFVTWRYEINPTFCSKISEGVGGEGLLAGTSSD